MKKVEKIYNNEKEDIVSRKVPEYIKDKNPIYAEIDEMPKGCFVIGGAARSLAFSMFNKSLNGDIPPVRDVDVAFNPEEVSSDEADIYAWKFSPDDAEHGHQAQEIIDFEDYMNSRDFTMNQVAYKDGELIMSKQAIKDIRKGVIRPCDDRVGVDYSWDDEIDEYREEYYHNNEISTRLALKAVLQQTVMSDYVKDIRIERGVYNEDFDINEYNSSYNGFQLALCIQKSFDYGRDVPERFLRNLIDNDIFERKDDFDLLIDENGDLRDLYDIMTDLNEDIMSIPFDFRNQAADFYLSETNDREYAKEYERYAEFEEYMEKYENAGKNYRGNIQI